jgi:hypothetical protein
VYVFLQQEIERREGMTNLADAVVDSLVLWALEGTDPDKHIMMTPDDIRARILDETPHAKALLDTGLERRLQFLGSKKGGHERGVRWHRKTNQYVLPYDTRKHIEDENLADEQLRLEVLRSLHRRAAEVIPAGEGNDVLAAMAAEVALRAVQRMFECEGLELAAFVSASPNGNGDAITGEEAVRFALDELKVPGKDRVAVGGAAEASIRGAFYHSVEEERAYFSKLSKTYSLFFVMAADPRIIEYFQDLAGDFYLYVGSDVLVRAMSERYVPDAAKMTRNTLLMAQRAGAKLVLTEAVLDEVWGHLKSSDNLFKSEWSHVESHVTDEVARQIPKILIRAYFYAKLNPTEHQGHAGNWPAFVGQFTTAQYLHKISGRDELRGYFERQLGMVYRSHADLDKYVTPDEVDRLAEAMKDTKSTEQLERNDALMVSAVYGRRRVRRETAAASEFGLNTWWLTDERTILSRTRDLIKEHHGERYMMRPDFLLNFLGLSPKVSEVRKSFSSVFPSLLGLRLSKRMDEDEFAKLMAKVNEAQGLEPGRLEAAMGAAVDQPKGDFLKKYSLPPGV